jgi:catechol 2,3-dioxygenase-like lactoylglutathione lyase family enzyme
MKISENIVGIQHIGIPTNDIEKTKEFFTSLGFELAYETEKKNLCFLNLKNICIETYVSPSAAGKPGAVDHIAIDVADIEDAFETIKSAGCYQMLDNEIRFVPFWENGVKFFKIAGPNGEIVEFSQIL